MKWYSVKDIENAANGVNQRVKEHSRQKGEELANHILQRTSEGRGLWFIVLWPAWFLIFIFSGVFFTNLLSKMGMDVPLSWIGMVGGFMFASAWYKSNFTIQHPFWSSIFGYFGTAFAALFLAKNLGISL